MTTSLESLIIDTVNKGFVVEFKMSSDFDCYCHIRPEKARAFSHVHDDQKSIGQSKSCSDFGRAYESAMSAIDWIQKKTTP